jgi:glyoxylase-like metal-dependent hydrolase (beta-lactamase superfamily II)
MPSTITASVGQDPSTRLKWATFVTPSIPVVAPDIAPGEPARPWPPISSTLISGDRDAVLADSFITHDQARAQADWIASTGKNLTTIFATHGHGDHCFGASVLLERFPTARFVAAPSAVQAMKEQTAPEVVSAFWEPRLPESAPDASGGGRGTAVERHRTRGRTIGCGPARIHGQCGHDMLTRPFTGTDRRRGCRL